MGVIDDRSVRNGINTYMTEFKKLWEKRVIPLWIKYLQDDLSEGEAAELKGYVGAYERLWDDFELMYAEYACDAFRMRREARVYFARLFVQQVFRRNNRKMFWQKVVNAVRKRVIKPLRRYF